MSQVDHPIHYGGADNTYETIKVLEAWLTPEEYIGFLKGNSLKYLSRHRHKGGAQDLDKALWYQARLDGAICRRGDAVAVTVDEVIPGFRGLRERWWRREDEIPFPDWQTFGVAA